MRLQIQWESSSCWLKIILMGFKKLYPLRNLTPKMHFLLHLVHQLDFGPIKYCSVIRMEAKHNFFKQMRWKFFRNLPLSIAKRHQMNLCYEMGDMENSKFLEMCDEIIEDRAVVFDDAYPTLIPTFRAQIVINYVQGNIGGVSVSSLKKLIADGFAL